MIRDQQMEVSNKINLSDIPLNKNREIGILADISQGFPEEKYIKIVNVNGKIVIFIEKLEDVIIKEWEGHMPYKKIIRDLEDDMEE